MENKFLPLPPLTHMPSGLDSVLLFENEAVPHKVFLENMDDVRNALDSLPSSIATQEIDASMRQSSMAEAELAVLDAGDIETFFATIENAMERGQDLSRSTNHRLIPELAEEIIAPTNVNAESAQSTLPLALLQDVRGIDYRPIAEEMWQEWMEGQRQIVAQRLSDGRFLQMHSVCHKYLDALGQKRSFMPLSCEVLMKIAQTSRYKRMTAEILSVWLSNQSLPQEKLFLLDQFVDDNRVSVDQLCRYIDFYRGVLVLTGKRVLDIAKIGDYIRTHQNIEFREAINIDGSLTRLGQKILAQVESIKG